MIPASIASYRSNAWTANQPFGIEEDGFPSMGALRSASITDRCYHGISPLKQQCCARKRGTSDAWIDTLRMEASVISLLIKLASLQKHKWPPILAAIVVLFVVGGHGDTYRYSRQEAPESWRSCNRHMPAASAVTDPISLHRETSDAA